MSALHNLARKAGLQIDWKDAGGQKQGVSDESLVRVLGALGLPAEDKKSIAESRKRLRAEKEALPPLITADAGEAIKLPSGFPSEGRAELLTEDGSSRAVELGSSLKIEEPGYHRLQAGETSIIIAVAPKRCFTVGDAAPGRRVWAPAVQIPSLQDRRGEAYGDFGSLARFAEAAARHGADALAISPVHALFPADPSRYGPYAPSTRLFLNVLFADPSQLGGEATSAAPSEDLIDWQAAIPARMRRLRSLYDERSEATRRDVEVFRKSLGEELELHVRYDALHAHFFSQGLGGWQSWPEEYHDPTGAAVSRFAAEHEEEVGFYAFLQWLADKSLAAAQKVARDSGMAIGLIADLAVGMEGGGSHAWSRRDALLTGLSVGAPPDALGPDGQDWGITTFSPRALRKTGFEGFIGTVRSALRNAGGIRIDHAMGLRRLWVVPHGSSSKDGAYLSYPEDDLLRLLALESWRAKAIVVGEDLGTVPPGFRDTIKERGILGMRVLMFERNSRGGFRQPGKWTARAAAMSSTHDLPTIAGWWCGRDIDWNWKLGRSSSFESKEAEFEARGEDRDRLWKACRKAGTASGRRPKREEPDAAVDAALSYVASAPSDIAIIPAEDLLGVPEQPNLPGTIDEHPNWRRRLPGLAEDMLDEPSVSRRIERIRQARQG